VGLTLLDVLEDIGASLKTIAVCLEHHEMREAAKINNLNKVQVESTDEVMNLALQQYNGLQSRIDEVFGDGLTVEEMIRRRKEYDEQG